MCMDEAMWPYQEPEEYFDSCTCVQGANGAIVSLCSGNVASLCYRKFLMDSLASSVIGWLPKAMSNLMIILSS